MKGAAAFPSNPLTEISCGPANPAPEARHRLARPARAGEKTKKRPSTGGATRAYSHATKIAALSFCACSGRPQPDHLPLPWYLPSQMPHSSPSLRRVGAFALAVIFPLRFPLSSRLPDEGRDRGAHAFPRADDLSRRRREGPLFDFHLIALPPSKLRVILSVAKNLLFTIGMHIQSRRNPKKRIVFRQGPASAVPKEIPRTARSSKSRESRRTSDAVRAPP